MGAEASYPMIIFEDCTAIGSQTLIEREFKWIGTESVEWESIVAESRNAATKPDPAAALENRIKELPAFPPTFGMSDIRPRVLKDLAMAIRRAKVPGPEVLRGPIQIYQRQLEFLKQHSTLKKGA